MEQRPFGTTGMNVSALGFGCGNVGGLMVRGSFEEQTAAVQRALGAGITYFDTAAQYGNGRSEENLGRVLTHLNAWDRVHVGTKLRLVAEEFSDPAPAIRRRMTENLQRLGRDSVDLIQLHNHLTLTDDSDRIGAEHHEAVAAAMRDLVREGLARHIGFTGMGDTGKVAEAISGGSFESIQAYFNALNPSYGFASASGGSQDFGGLIDRAAAQGLAVIAIRVLSGGALAGTSERAALASPTPGDLVPGSVFEEDVKRAKRLTVLASELGCESAPELSLRLVLANPGVSTALIGFSDQTQLEDAIRWAEHGPLSDDAVRRVVEIAQAQLAG